MGRMLTSTFFAPRRFVSQISEAYPEVPWVFVFRDPVEVMVSNLKSYAGAPCVRIPRQDRLRKQASKKFKTPGGGYPATAKSRTVRDAALRDRRPKFGREWGQERFGREPKGVRGGGKKSRSLVEAAGGVLGGSAPREELTTTANGLDVGSGGGSDAFSETRTDVAVWEEEEVEEEGDSSAYAGSVSWGSDVSWGGDISGGIESSDLPLYPTLHPSSAAAAPLLEPSPWESAAAAAFGADEERRSLATKKTGQLLNMNMTMECADWLQVSGVHV